MVPQLAEVAYGPMLIGLLLNIMLYGITITQTYIYYCSSKRDRWKIQAYVYFLFVVDTVHSIIVSISVYKPLINHFGDVSALEKGDWLVAAEPAMTGLIGGLVQMFYVHRLKVMTRNNRLAYIVLFCAITSILMGIATGAAIHWVPYFTEFQRFQVVVITWLASAAIGDCFITTGLVIALRRMKSGLRRSDTRVDKIIRLTIQTGEAGIFSGEDEHVDEPLSFPNSGLLTAIWAMVDLFVYLFNPTGLHLIFNLPLAKLYTNSLMSSLNARDFWKPEDNITDNTTGNFGRFQFTSFANRITRNRDGNRSLTTIPKINDTAT